MATITERYATQLSEKRAEVGYLVEEATDAVDARQAILNGAASSFGDLDLIDARVQAIEGSDDTWLGRAIYGNENNQQPPPPATGQSRFAFDTGGGSQHITQSRATVAGYAPAGETAPDYDGAIGVSESGVEGTDIVVPQYTFEETHYLSAGTVDSSYKGTLFALTGRVNNATFKGLAAGECLFLGAAGQQRSGGDWEVTFRFAGSPNATGLTIGSITGVDKKGWEYLWVRYEDADDTTANKLVKVPAAVYVERVYLEGDFSLLGIGTS